MDADRARTTTTRWRPLVGRWASRIVVLVALIFSAVALGSGITGDESSNSVANLPADAESARASELQESLGTSKFTPVFAVFDRGGEKLSEEDRRFVGEKVRELQDLAAEGQKAFPVFAEDGAAAFVGVPLATDPSGDSYEEPVADIRELAAADLPDGLEAQATGGPAFSVDLSKVFDGADVRLLVTTAGVVALLLLLTYRSPWLWLVPLTVVAVADQVAATAVDVASRIFPFTVDGQSTGITSVLVFGAGTNYALLLIARYREELRREESRYDAMRVAWRQAAPAILASSGTVVLALLCLGFADSPSSRNIGYGGAIGILVAVVYALLVLPAAMTLFGRRLFWPFVPKVGQADPTATGFWSKVAAVVTGRPVLVSVAGVAVLAVLAIPLTGVAAGLSQTEQFRATPQSVTGQEVLAEHFAAGASQPTSLLTPTAAADDVRRAVAEVDGVDRVEPAGSADGTTVLTAVLGAEPASEAALETVESIREAAQGVEPKVLVGGADAESLDSETATARDQMLIIPMILAVVLLVLLVLLRSVVAAVLLVLTVVATFAASLGASWWAFQHWFDFPALDYSVPLLSFLFLVALGVDYNIFLTTRAKEEARRHDTKTAISVALAVTGGVITSAGILLAAVFTVLGVLPLIVLTQVGVIVGFGVLLDTLLVRSVLVPALVSLLGRRFWWPGALSREPVRADQ
ncbi:MMPL family transporter [Nocardioides sp. cx-169]|uniref:MMPL family transporter n=1 Tax=Nocardioides sp. cx-169 TaxID=2899080 RepID=UPI001E3D3F93|nr:MMPL family transporter [Nocardioides sp. cx-169]MCD4533409.1 MMPL family transporter [Nocardioides sp. cx-169]